MPPPIAVIIPSSAAGTTDSPASEALTAPFTQNSARPAASRVRMMFSQRATTGCQKNVATPASDGREQVAPVGEAGRRYVAEQHVADESAAETRDEGEDQGAEDVQALADGDEGTGQREDEDPGEVEGEGDVLVHRS